MSRSEVEVQTSKVKGSFVFSSIQGYTWVREKKMCTYCACVVHTKQPYYSYTTNSGVQYGVVQKFVTVYLESSDFLHFTLINPLTVGRCSALRELAYPIELADNYGIITMDYVL